MNYVLRFDAVYVTLQGVAVSQPRSQSMSNFSIYYSYDLAGMGL